MEREFCSYEQALALKELGFAGPCLGTYYYAGKVLDISEYINHGKYTVLAPLKQQVFTWFREKYNVDCYITRMLPNVVNRDLYHVVLNDRWAPNDSYKNYEDAESRLIDNLIELAKHQVIS
jgi:hypothetical protein